VQAKPNLVRTRLQRWLEVRRRGGLLRLLRRLQHPRDQLRNAEGLLALARRSGARPEEPSQLPRSLPGLLEVAPPSRGHRQDARGAASEGRRAPAAHPLDRRSGPRPGGDPRAGARRLPGHGPPGPAARRGPRAHRGRLPRRLALRRQGRQGEGRRRPRARHEVRQGEAPPGERGPAALDRGVRGSPGSPSAEAPLPEPAHRPDVGAQGAAAALARRGGGSRSAPDLALRGHEALHGHGRDPPRCVRAPPAAVPRARLGRVDAPLRTPGRQRDARGASAVGGRPPTRVPEAKPRSRKDLRVGPPGFEPGGRNDTMAISDRCEAGEALRP
jgi:hypothetical protein